MELEYSQIKETEFASIIASEANANSKTKMLKAEHSFWHDGTMKTVFVVLVNKREVCQTAIIHFAIEEYNRY